MGDIPLSVQLRTSEHGDAYGMVEALEKIVRAIRKRCRRARIIIRGDSGFCHEEIMAWCEHLSHVVYFCVGLAKNSVLIGKLAPALAPARARRCLSPNDAIEVGERGRLDRYRRRPADAPAAMALAHQTVSGIRHPICSARRRTERPGRSRSPFPTALFRLSGGAASARAFSEFEYLTRQSWSRSRRVIGKAEVMSEEDNPRFVVTNLPAEGFKGDADRACFTPQRLYEEFYCGRGEMENVLKQQTLELQADRLSTHFLASNQLRLWLAPLAYLLMERLRAPGLAGTELAQATVGSVRLKGLKVAAQVRISVPRVYVQLCSAYPMQDLFRLCNRLLRSPALFSG
jgi:hypothetical protein